MSLEALVKHAKILDKVDLITGPLAALCYQSGHEGLQHVGVVISALEFTLFKLPFALRYLVQTGDYKALLYWGPKEILSNFIPQAGYIDIMPVYRMRTEFVVGGCNV